MKAKKILKNALYFLDVKKCRRVKTPPNSIPFLILWVTNKCNLRCKMCDLWKVDPATFSQELSTEEWYEVIDSAVKMHTMVISITGGEPFLRPDIFQILKRIRENKIAHHVCTNGILLNRAIIERLKDVPPNSISISLDSDQAEVHNKLRGADCFHTIVEGIQLLRRNLPNIKIGINCLICKQNLRGITRMVSFAESLGADQIKFAPIFTNLQHKRKPLESFHGLLFTKDDLPELQKEIRKLRYALSRTKLHTASSIFIREIPSFSIGQHPRFLCYAGYISCAIDPCGIVSPCWDIEGPESIRHKPLEEIWKSSSFQQLRQKVDSCSSNCWCAADTELSIRCSTWFLFKNFSQVLKDIRYYLRKRDIS